MNAFGADENFKNQIIMVLNFLINGLIIICLAHSYLTKSFRLIKIQTIILHLINAVSMLTPVAEDSG